MIEFITARKRKPEEVAESSMTFDKNKMIIAAIVLLLIVAFFVLQPTGPSAGTSPAKVASPTEAGNVISDLSSSAAGAGSLLEDIDNSIG